MASNSIFRNENIALSCKSTKQFFRSHSVQILNTIPSYVPRSLEFSIPTISERDHWHTVLVLIWYKYTNQHLGFSCLSVNFLKQVIFFSDRL